MVRVASHANTDHGGRLRCGPASEPSNLGLAKSLRLPSAARSRPLRDWTDQRWLAVARRFQPDKEAEGVGLPAEDFVPSHAVRSVHLSQCGSDRRGLIADLRRILGPSREAFLCPRERHQLLTLYGCVAQLAVQRRA